MYQYQAPQKRSSRGRKLVIWIVVVLVVLVGLDFGAKFAAESVAASEIQKQGFPVKPSVSIAGFPFLTQVIARNFHQVTISSSAFKEGPITIKSMTVTTDNIKVNSSFNGGTTGALNGVVVISLGEVGGFLSAAGPLTSFLGGGSGGGLTVQAVGSNQLKASFKLVGGFVNGSATWKVVSVPPNQIELQLVSSNGLPSKFLSAANNIKIPLKSLPAGLRLTGQLSSSAGGIVAHVTADSLSFGS